MSVRQHHWRCRSKTISCDAGRVRIQPGSSNVRICNRQNGSDCCTIHTLYGLERYNRHFWSLRKLYSVRSNVEIPQRRNPITLVSIFSQLFSQENWVSCSMLIAKGFSISYLKIENYCPTNRSKHRAAVWFVSGFPYEPNASETKCSSFARRSIISMHPLTSLPSSSAATTAS